MITVRHLFGGIVGGLAFGLVSGLLLGSCVFEAGPNHASVSGVRRGTEAPAGQAGGEPAPSAPGGMDPGGGVMDAVFKRIAELKATIAAQPDNRAALLELANLYYDANKYDQAVPLYERALAADRSDPNTMTDLATAYWQSGQSEMARKLFQEVQTRFPGHWQSAVNLFLLAASEKDIGLAGAALESVRRENPGFEKLGDMERIYRELQAGGKG